MISNRRNSKIVKKTSYWGKSYVPFLFSLLTTVISSLTTIFIINIQRDSDIRKETENIRLDYIIKFNIKFYDECINLNENIYTSAQKIILNHNGFSAISYDTLQAQMELFQFFINKYSQSIDTNVIKAGNEFLEFLNTNINPIAIKKDKIYKIEPEQQIDIINEELNTRYEAFKKKIYIYCIKDVKSIN